MYTVIYWLFIRHEKTTSEKFNLHIGIPLQWQVIYSRNLRGDAIIVRADANMVYTSMVTDVLNVIYDI